MNTDPVALNAMMLMSSVFFLFFGIIWKSNDLPNVFIKVFCIIMAFWTGMNFIALVWFGAQ